MGRIYAVSVLLRDSTSAIDDFASDSRNSLDPLLQFEIEVMYLQGRHRTSVLTSDPARPAGPFRWRGPSGGRGGDVEPGRGGVNEGAMRSSAGSEATGASEQLLQNLSLQGLSQGASEAVASVISKLLRDAAERGVELEISLPREGDWQSN